MSLAKKIMSAILAAGMCIVPFAEVTASAVNDEKNVYVYDTTNSEKSKVSESENEAPFNVFDIYNAYYEMVSQTTAPVTSAATTAKRTTTTAAVSSTKKTTAKITTTTKNSNQYIKKGSPCRDSLIFVLIIQKFRWKRTLRRLSVLLRKQLHHH